MSLFVCEQCGYIENTATSHYWIRGKYGHDTRALCSNCDPDPALQRRFDFGPWNGELVLNPDVVHRFIYFKCDPKKCSHISLGKAGTFHLGAIRVCRDCGISGEVVDTDTGRERRIIEKDHIYKPEDLEWRITYDI